MTTYDFSEVRLSELMRIAAGRAYRDARYIKRVATIGGDWDDPRDEQQYQHDMALYGEFLERANRLEREERTA